jgi:hypothetical protein
LPLLDAVAEVSPWTESLLSIYHPTSFAPAKHSSCLASSSSSVDTCTTWIIPWSTC